MTAHQLISFFFDQSFFPIRSFLANSTLLQIVKIPQLILYHLFFYFHPVWASSFVWFWFLGYPFFLRFFAIVARLFVFRDYALPDLCGFISGWTVKEFIGQANWILLPPPVLFSRTRRYDCGRARVANAPLSFRSLRPDVCLSPCLTSDRFLTSRFVPSCF